MSSRRWLAMAMVAALLVTVAAVGDCPGASPSAVSTTITVTSTTFKTSSPISTQNQPCRTYWIYAPTNQGGSGAVGVLFNAKAPSASNWNCNGCNSQDQWFAEYGYVQMRGVNWIDNYVSVGGQQTQDQPFFIEENSVVVYFAVNLPSNSGNKNVYLPQTDAVGIYKTMFVSATNNNTVNLPTYTATGYYVIRLVMRYSLPSFAEDVLVFALGNSGCGNIYATAYGTFSGNTVTINMPTIDENTRYLCVSPGTPNNFYNQGAPTDSNGDKFQFKAIDIDANFASSCTTVTRYDNTADFQLTIQHVNTYAYFVYSLASSVTQSCYNTTFPTTKMATGTSSVLNFKVPLTPGAYGICIGWEGAPISQWFYQSVSNRKFVYYRSSPFSATAISPTSTIMGTSSVTFQVTTAASYMGEAISNYPQATVAFSLNGVDCTKRTANLTIGTGVNPNLQSVIPATYFPIAQNYKLCFTVNSWATWDIVQGLTVDVYNRTSTTIRAISPTSVPCSATTVFQVATTGYLPSTARLVFATDSLCSSTIFNGPMSTGTASVAITTACSSPQTLYVCYAPDTGAAAPSGLTINVRGNTVITGVTPNVVLFAGTITLDFASPDVVSSQSRIKLVQAGNPCSYSSAPTSQAYNGYPIGFTGLTAGTTYFVCYSVDNGGTYVPFTAVTVSVLAIPTAISLTWSQGLAVAGRANQFVAITTPLPVGMPGAIVFLTQTTCGASGTTPYLYDSSKPFVIPISTAFTTASTVQLCFSQDGTTGGAVQQNGALTMLAEATVNSLTISPTNPRVASGQSLALTLSGVLFSSVMITFAPVGLCDSASAQFVPAFPYSGTTITKTFTIPASMAGHSLYQIYPCVSVNGGAYFSQTGNAGNLIYVGTAMSTTMTDIQPAQFVVSAPVIVSFTGPLPTPVTKIAFSTDSMCNAGIIPTCSATYSTSGSLSFPSCTMTLQSLWLCLSMDGTSNYITQLLVNPQVTNDPLAGAIQSINSPVIGVGNRATITIAMGGNFATGSNVFLGFSPTVTCTTCNTTCEGMTTVLSSSPTLGVPFATPNSWTVCFSVNNKVAWSVQVSASVRSIRATTSYITSISPNIVGRGNMKLLAFAGIDGSYTSYIGFVAGVSTCASGPIPATIQNVPLGTTSLNVNISVTSFNAGVYTLCYSTNGTVGTGIWFAQSPQLTVVAVNATSLSNFSPKLIGEATSPVMNFILTGSFLSGDTYLALGVGGCVTRFNPVNLISSTSFTLTTPLACNNYVVCLSTQNNVWIQQTNPGLTLVVIGTQTTSLTAVLPNTIGVNTQPNISFTGAVPSVTTAVAFVDFAGNCGTLAMLSITPLMITTNASLSQPFNLPIDTSMVICYTTNFGVATPNWKPQSIPVLKVLAGGANAVSSITPTLVGTGVAITFSITITGGVTPTSYIAFATSQSGCLSSGTRQGTTQYTGSTLSIASYITAPGTYYTCYAVDGIDGTYTAQVAVASQINVVSAAAGSITSVTPNVIGDTIPLSLVVVGISATPTTAISFSLDATCATGRQSVTTTTTPGQTVVAMTAGLSPAGPYTVCYTTGAGWVAQTSVTLTVLSATATSLSILTPNFIGTSVTLGLTLGSDQLTPLAYVAFAQSGQCGSANLYSVMPYATSVFMTGPLPSAGTYDLCYSVRNGTAGTWVAQSGVHMIAAIPDFYAVAGLFPNGMGSGTLPTLTLTMNDARVAAPQTAMAFVFDTDDCNTVGNRLVVRTVTNWGSFPMPTSINTGGLFRICLSYNLIDWTKQINDSAAMTVIAATPTSVGGIMPTLYQNGQITRVTLTGVTFTSTSVFAFAQTGQCSITRFAQTPYAPGGDGGVDMASPLETGLPAVNLTLCYSVNNGLTWVEQSAILVLAVTACDDADALGTCEQCHKQPYCSWCTSQNLCAVNINGSLCAEEDIVVPGDPIGCPAVTYPSRMTGSTAGMTMVTLGGNGRFFDTDEMSCHWDFIVSTNQTKFTVLSDSSGWCLSPPVQTVNVAYLSVRYRDVPFTSVAQRGVWTYYDCEQRISGLCTDCYNLAKPDCGTCFDTGACQAGFQCSGLWGGALCPAIDDIEPQQINFRGGVELEVTGTLFVNSSSMACYFTPTSGATGLVYSNVTYMNETMVTCMAPPFDPQTIVKVTLWDRGLLYTSQPVTIVYLDDPPPAAVIQPPAPLPVDHLTIPLASTIVGLVFIGALILFVVLHRRRKARQALMPPDLTPALKEQIIFGEFKASPNVKQLVPHVTPLMELLLIPNSPILGALIKATESTESDQVSRALVYVTETRSRTIDVMKHVVTLEVKEAESMPTLFRTNSFVTKMFKVYSKIVGLEYVHSTLGYELNASLHSARTGEGEDALDVKDDSNDEVQLNKLILLTVCQRVLLAITKNEKDVPNQFRELFAHVKTCMQTKFPASNESLARLTAGNLSAALMETRMALSQEGPLSANDISNLQMALVSGLADGRMDPGTQSQLSGVAGNVSTLSSQLMATLKACKDMEASMYPDSEEAKRVVAEHNQAQNAIAVGGFFFLRFVVPALTAPDSYALVREPPDGATIKILVLCGKVLQNLSNDKEMGGKEAYMAKMNEFIVSNRKPMHKFQNNLMTKRENEAGQYAPVPVPQRHADAAAVYLYEYIISRFRHIMEALDTPQPGEDAAAGLTRTQMANMLVHVVGSINQAAGEYAPKPRTANDSVEAVAARRAQGMSLNSSAYSSTAFQSVKMINLTTDMSKLESGNSITPAPITLDSGAGAGTGSMDPTSNPAFGSV